MVEAGGCVEEEDDEDDDDGHGAGAGSGSGDFVGGFGTAGCFADVDHYSWTLKVLLAAAAFFP